MRPTKIKVIVWDVDGTLYQSRPGTKSFKPIAAVFDRAKKELTQKYWQRPYQPELERLFKSYKHKYHSTTKTLAVMTNQSLAWVNKYIEKRLRQRRLKPDSKLIKLFQRLDHIYHLVLRNGGRAETCRILKMLGLDQVKYNYQTELGPFIKVWGTVDDFNEVKPNPFVFDQVKIWIYRQLLHQSNKPVNLKTINQAIRQVLMVGDRPEVDLKTAKQVGFQTALVWTDLDTKPNYVDYYFDSIFSLGQWLIRTS